MLMKMNRLLEVAKKNDFAVGAFNICDSLLFKCAMDAAETNNAPVIVELAPPEMEYVGDDFFEFVKKRMNDSKIPCVLHLDHGKTVQDCMRAIRNGFTSIMIDGSQLNYEDNVKLTSEVTNFAHSIDIPVEAEIGTIGAMTVNSVENVNYTDPDQVVDFLNRTSVDTLAVAIGTAHGIYPEGFVPKIRLDILREITEKTNHPLVLHGGSSNPDNEIREACKLGISKVNIASDYRKAFFDTTGNILAEKKLFWSPKVYEEPIKEAIKVITNKMELFGCIDKADLYK